MNKNKKPFFVMVSCLIFAVVSAFGLSEAGAQQKRQDAKKDFRGGDGGRGKYEFGFYDAMKSRLGLSDAQVKQIFDINQKYKTQRFDARADSEKTRQLMNAEREEIKSVLTDEQKKKFEEFGKQREVRPGDKNKNADKRQKDQRSKDKKQK